MGAIVAVIGLELAGVAANMAGLLPTEGTSADSTTITISLVTLAVTVLGSVLFPGFLAIIPILIRRAGGLCAVVLHGRGGFDPDPRGSLVRAADLLHPAL